MASILISPWFMLHVKLEMAILNMFAVKIKIKLKKRTKWCFHTWWRFATTVDPSIALAPLIYHTGFFPPLFPFSPHWPVRQICRGHSALPAVSFERAVALNYSALAGNVSVSINGLPKSKLCGCYFAITPITSFVGWYQHGAAGMATHPKRQLLHHETGHGMM